MSDILCPSCNAQNAPGSVFCDNCGYDLRTVAAAPAPTPTPVVAPGPLGGGVTCPSCRTVNVAGASFCENCGAQLGQVTPQPAPPVAVQPPVIQPPVYTPPPVVQPTYVTGRLVVQGSNVSIPIPSGKPIVIIGREDPVSGIFPDIDLEQQGGMNAGVGRQHAKLTAQGGQIFVEDMNTVNFTFLNKQKILPGQPKPLNNGDELRFGKLVLNYYSS